MFRPHTVLALLVTFTVLTGYAQDAEDAAEPVALPFCDCMNMINLTDELRESCTEFVESNDRETIERTFSQCETDPLGAAEVTVCYCLTGRATEPDVVEACEALVPPDMPKLEKYELAQSCDPDD